MDASHRLAAALAALGAFLLFLVEPLIARRLLPAFGGTAAVWTTCLLCFQGLLVGGYAAAHGLSRLPTPRRPCRISRQTPRRTWPRTPRRRPPCPPA